MPSYTKYSAILECNLIASLLKEFGENVFEQMPDETPLTKLLRGIREARELFQRSQNRQALMKVKQVFDSMAVDVDQFNVQNSKDTDFNNINPYMGYVVTPVEGISIDTPAEEREEFLRNYIRQRYDFFENSNISELELNVCLSVMRTLPSNFRREIGSSLARCPYYEPALYRYCQQNGEICSTYKTVWSQVASIITSGIVARISQMDCTEQEKQTLRTRLENYAQTEKYTGKVLNRLPGVAEILKQHPVVLTGSNMASDLTDFDPRYAPWKFSCRNEKCLQITIRVFTPSKIVEFTNGRIKPKDISLSGKFQNFKARLSANATGEIQAPEVTLKYLDKTEETVEMEEGCDADLIVLPGYDLVKTAEAIFSDEKERNPKLELTMESQDRATGTIFNIRAQYPRDSAMDSVLAFMNYMPKQIYQVDPSFVFQHHISQVRAYLSWNEIGGDYRLTYDPSYCSGCYCSNFFCIASKKEGALSILSKYKQRGVEFVDLGHLVNSDDYYYCWVQG